MKNHKISCFFKFFQMSLLLQLKQFTLNEGLDYDPVKLVVVFLYYR